MFTPDGRVSAWGGKGFVALTDPGTARELARLEDPNQDGYYDMAITPDGTQLIGFSDDSQCLRVWDLRAIRAGLSIVSASTGDHHPHSARSVRISPKGSGQAGEHRLECAPARRCPTT